MQFQQVTSDISKIQPEKRGVNKAKYEKRKKVLINTRLDGKLTKKLDKHCNLALWKGSWTITMFC